MAAYNSFDTNLLTECGLGTFNESKDFGLQFPFDVAPEVAFEDAFAADNGDDD